MPSGGREPSVLVATSWLCDARLEHAGMGSSNRHVIATTKGVAAV